MLAWVVIFSTDSRRLTHCRHVTKIPSPQLLLFPELTNRDACNLFRIRSYANCRVVCPLVLFSSIFRTLFQVPYPVSPLLATLAKTAGVCANNSHSGNLCARQPNSLLTIPDPLSIPRLVVSCE
jgi:hypothetical protein